MPVITKILIDAAIFFTLASLWLNTVWSAVYFQPRRLAVVIYARTSFFGNPWFRRMAEYWDVEFHFHGFLHGTVQAVLGGLILARS